MTHLSTDLETLYPEHLELITKRYLEAAQQAGKEGLLISSGALKYAFLDDHSYPFKVNPHFKSWLPITGVNDSFILIKGNQKPQLLYHQPDDYWHMKPADPEGYWVDRWQIQPIGQPVDAHNLVGDTSKLAFIGEEADLAKEWGFDNTNDTNILNSIHFDRAYKTRYELACLQLANLKAAKGHHAAEQAFRQGQSEFEIQHAYLAAIEHREQQTPYSSIVALNEHAAVLHYQHYDFAAKATDDLHSLLIDAGAEQHGYAADVTRTYAFRDGIFKDLVNSMDAAQQAIINDIKVGMDYPELNKKMHIRLANILQSSGLVNLSVDAMIDNNITFTFLPHGLGHFLGLQTHDVAGFQQSKSGINKSAPANYPALRLTRPIENNQVFTIEPGLYFIPSLLTELRRSSHTKNINWPLIESLMPCGGIRIEDNIAIIDSLPVNLTRDAFLGL
ncbi:MAG: Xaa-Pro dipeptidase [Pseudomonadales bacterium]|nr:Xaa-Pro dipeptidase [Pseudomonadales bacterium]